MILAPTVAGLSIPSDPSKPRARLPGKITFVAILLQLVAQGALGDPQTLDGKLAGTADLGKVRRMWSRSRSFMLSGLTGDSPTSAAAAKPRRGPDAQARWWLPGQESMPAGRRFPARARCPARGGRTAARRGRKPQPATPEALAMDGNKPPGQRHDVFRPLPQGRNRNRETFKR